MREGRRSTPLPGSRGVRAHLELLPIFEQPGFRFADFKGACYVWSPPAERFRDLLYDRGFVLDFDWPAWQDQAIRFVQDPALLAQADLATICRLLTTHVRKDRFRAGHLAEVFERGHLVALLRRLATIAEGMPRPVSGRRRSQRRESIAIALRLYFRIALPRTRNQRGSGKATINGSRPQPRRAREPSIAGTIATTMATMPTE